MKLVGAVSLLGSLGYAAEPVVALIGDCVPATSLLTLASVAYVGVRGKPNGMMGFLDFPIDC